MKPVQDLQLGFADAENYQIRENKELFNAIFVKNEFLKSLLHSSKYFLIGEKGRAKPHMLFSYKTTSTETIFHN